MASSFNKEERNAFEQILESFQDALAMSALVGRYQTDQTTMERTGNVIWRPVPYIGQSFDGADQSGNFKNYTQMSVPSTISTRKSVPFQMSDIELRDALQENRLGEAAKRKLASDINLSIVNVICNQGTLFVKRTGVATGYDDLAECDALMNEQGVPKEDRIIALTSRDYNAMAGDLSKASRSLDNEISVAALRKAYLGDLAGFGTFKLDYGLRKTLAGGGGGLTLSTLAGGVNIYVPKATSVAGTGESANVDNRFQRITLTSTTNVAAGDAFTIAGLEAVHHENKVSTGRLKTFRVISVDSATTMTISPPIISAQDGSQASTVYQNVTNTAPSGTAAIVFINTATNAINPFWLKSSIELLPGRIAMPSNAGIDVMRGTTDQGVELVMMKGADIDTGQIKYRFDSLYGVVNLQPEMSGIMMFSQV